MSAPRREAERRGEIRPGGIEIAHIEGLKQLADEHEEERIASSQ